MPRQQPDSSPPEADRSDRRLPGVLQVHLDPLWAIAGTFGLKLAPNDYIYRETVPLLLEILDGYGLKATFFVIGRELKMPLARSTLETIRRHGHEIANHSQNHPIGFRHLSPGEKETEIAEAERIFQDTIGVTPRGFSAPAFDIDEVTLKILQERGYLYDSSVFPSYFALLTKVFRHLKSFRQNRGEEKSIQASSWGRLEFMFAPRRPYRPGPGNLRRPGGSGILEIPISSIPGIGLPFYHYFCLFAGEWYFRLGIRAFKLAGRELNFLIHPTELLNPDDLRANDLDYIPIPTSNISLKKKIDFMHRVLRGIIADFRLQPAIEFARRRGEAAKPGESTAAEAR